MKNELMLKGSEVLDIQLNSLQEAEALLGQVAKMDKVSFYARGKAYKAIRDGIAAAKEGFPEGDSYAKYNSFKEYFEINGGSLPDSYQHAGHLMMSFALVEKMKADRVPYDELPNSERVARRRLSG